MNDVATREQTIPQRPISQENLVQIAAYIRAIQKRYPQQPGETKEDWLNRVKTEINLGEKRQAEEV